MSGRKLLDPTTYHLSAVLIISFHLEVVPFFQVLNLIPILANSPCKQSVCKPTRWFGYKSIRGHCIVSLPLHRPTMFEGRAPYRMLEPNTTEQSIRLKKIMQWGREGFYKFYSSSSSSSSIGSTALFELWPVEKCPSILLYLPPPISIFSPPSLGHLPLLPLSIFSWVVPFLSSVPVLG